DFFQALGEKTHPAVDFPQSFFAVNVVRVLAAVAELGGVADRLGYARALYLPQLFHFRAHAARAFWGDVARTARARRSPAPHQHTSRRLSMLIPGPGVGSGKPNIRL